VAVPELDIFDVKDHLLIILMDVILGFFILIQCSVLSQEQYKAIQCFIQAALLFTE